MSTPERNALVVIDRLPRALWILGAWQEMSTLGSRWQGCYPHRFSRAHQYKELAMTESTFGTAMGMGLVLLVLWFAVGGLITGALARWLLPGPDPMSWLTTIGYGIGGSLLGGFAARLLGVPEGFSFVLAVAGAAFLIWFFRRRKVSP